MSEKEPGLMSCAVISIAHVRSGGGFLSHCLSTHPQIQWTRGEVFLPGNLPAATWRKEFPNVGKVRILKFVGRAVHYRASGCRVTYDQLDENVWAHLAKGETKVLHLVRRDLLRSVISAILTSKSQAGDKDFKSYVLDGPPQRGRKVRIGASTVVTRIERLARRQRKIADNLTEFSVPHLNLTYGEIVGGEGVDCREIPERAARRICDFLSVRRGPLRADRRKVNPYNLAEIVTNYDEIADAVLEWAGRTNLNDAEWVAGLQIHGQGKDVA